MKLPQAEQKALELAAQLAPPNSPIYLVGGFVRDALLGRKSADIDLAMAGEPAIALEVARKLTQAAQPALPAYRVSPFSLDREFGVARVIFASTESESFYLDIAVLNGGSIAADLARRDFTINALALPLDKFLLNRELRLEDTLEVANGRQDLTNHLIRAVSEQNLIDDPLRLLRGIRLRAQLVRLSPDWEFAPGTLELFQKLSRLITRSASERIRDELNKTWLAGGVVNSLTALSDCDLLKTLIPELDGKEAEVINLSGWLEWLIDPKAKWSPAAKLTQPDAKIKYWPEMLAKLETNEAEPRALLYWAALLLKCGLEAANNILLRLRFSRNASDTILKLLQAQSQLAELSLLFNPATNSGITNRQAYRFLKDFNPVQLEALLLALAEEGAKGGENWPKQVTLTDFLSRKLLEESLIHQPRLLEGQQLMKALKLKPGPQVGQILRELEEAQADRQIKTTEEALELARELVQGRESRGES